ncbi:MAG: DUF1573 domain-containing protein [Flavobacteriaceae bacterium]|nr:DUF1573 domain-containing protein [Flavobacteriaceae bacterium]
MLFTLAGTQLSLGQMANTNMGVFQFEEEVIDYGTIQQNSNGVRYFEFKNRGRAPIVISKVNSSCGCTVPKFTREPIAPGESGIIEVKYSTKKLGQFSKSITVISNADEPQKILKIKGKVIAKSSSMR